MLDLNLEHTQTCFNSFHSIVNPTPPFLNNGEVLKVEGTSTPPRATNTQDPATGIQPFLPQVAPSSPLATILLPLALLFGVVRMALLIALALVHFVFVHLLLSPLGAAGRVLSTPLTALFARLALVVLGYYSIPSEIVQDKSRRRQGVAQAVRGVQRGDLIIASWSSYVDVLFYAFR